MYVYFLLWRTLCVWVETLPRRRRIKCKFLIDSVHQKQKKKTISMGAIFFFLGADFALRTAPTAKHFTSTFLQRNLFKYLLWFLSDKMNFAFFSCCKRYDFNSFKHKYNCLKLEFICFVWSRCFHILRFGHSICVCVCVCRCGWNSTNYYSTFRHLSALAASDAMNYIFRVLWNWLDACVMCWCSSRLHHLKRVHVYVHILNENVFIIIRMWIHSHIR